MTTPQQPVATITQDLPQSNQLPNQISQQNAASVGLIIFLVLLLGGAITFIVLFVLELQNYNSCNSGTNSILCPSISCYADSTLCCNSYQSNCIINDWISGGYYKQFPDGGIPPNYEDDAIFNMCLTEQERQQLCTTDNKFEFCKSGYPLCAVTSAPQKKFCGFGQDAQNPKGKNASVNLCYFPVDPEILKDVEFSKVKAECVNPNVKSLYAFAWKDQKNTPAYTYKSLFK